MADETTVEEVKTEDVVKEFKYFDGPGRGRKQCPACKKYMGVRVSACPCGHVFQSAPKPEKAAPPATPVVVPAFTPKEERVVDDAREAAVGERRVHGPAGPVPAPPKSASVEDVTKWAEDAREEYLKRSHGGYVTSSGLKYWIGMSRLPKDDERAMCKTINQIYGVDPAPR